jgi:sulfite reductase alpha subunit-like flavoprotein
MYGGALDVAEQVKPLFEEAGYVVDILEQPVLADITDSMPDLVLFCVSTTGSGDFPGNFVPLVRDLQSQSPSLSSLSYGLIALGDSSYGDTFCGAGRRLDELLADLGATRLGERLEVDAMETFMADDAALPWVAEWLASEQLPVNS